MSELLTYLQVSFHPHPGFHPESPTPLQSRNGLTLQIGALAF